jgi:hypothetical protein
MAAERPEHRGRITPMYLAHHWPEDYDRCVRIGRSHVCRRCLVLYPIAAVVMLATLGWHPPTAVDVLLLVLAPLPAVVEVVLEQVGGLTYSPQRQVVVTIPLAVALGRGFAIYLDDQTSLLFWGVVVVDSAICFAAVVWRHRRDARTGAAADGR